MQQYLSSLKKIFYKFTPSLEGDKLFINKVLSL